MCAKSNEWAYPTIGPTESALPLCEFFLGAVNPSAPPWWDVISHVQELARLLHELKTRY